MSRLGMNQTIHLSRLTGPSDLYPCDHVITWRNECGRIVYRAEMLHGDTATCGEIDRRLVRDMHKALEFHGEFKPAEQINMEGIR